MNFNPHYASANGLLQDGRYMSDNALARVQIDATLALAWEQARTSDELRTANLLAALQPVPITGGKEWRADEETVLRIRAEIGARLYPDFGPESAKGGVPE